MPSKSRPRAPVKVLGQGLNQNKAKHSPSNYKEALEELIDLTYSPSASSSDAEEPQTLRRARRTVRKASGQDTSR